jgi:RNase P subunit RPR2
MNCPRCNKAITSVNAEEITVETAAQRAPGLAHTCPECDAILSVQLDPMPLNDELVRDIARAVSALPTRARGQ